MGQKDLVSKQLGNYPDVFADIVNVFVYDGKSVVLEEELEPAPTETLYKGKNGNLRSQFHDVSKYHVVNGEKHLFNDNRLEDAKLVTTDENRRKELYQEYGLV